MPVNDVLTPQEASYIATNCYFTLENWINQQPRAGIESHANVVNKVLGPGTAGKPKPGDTNATLGGTALRKATLHSVVGGTSGLGTRSGFGYLLSFRRADRRHAVIATRGTRPELGAPDLITDMRGAMTGFGDYGLVHKGFKKTFDSVLHNLAPEHKTVMDADVVHCVGHSLGGGVATLMAAHYAALGKQVRLYTFGSPRVGAFMCYSALHKRIGAHNIYRVAHDLDPITLLGPFPYIHLNPSPSDANHLTLRSPTGMLFSFENHDMNRYIQSLDDTPQWTDAFAYARRTDHDNCVLAKWLLHDDASPNWVHYASAKTLGILFKLFAHVLRNVSTALILQLSAVDLLTEMLLNGLTKSAAFSAQVFTLLRHAATWAGVTIGAGARFTAEIIGKILVVMLARLQAMAMHAIHAVGNKLVAMPLVIAGGWALAHSAAF